MMNRALFIIPILMAGGLLAVPAHAQLTAMVSAAIPSPTTVSLTAPQSPQPLANALQTMVRNARQPQPAVLLAPAPTPAVRLILVPLQPSTAAAPAPSYKQMQPQPGAQVMAQLRQLQKAQKDAAQTPVAYRAPQPAPATAVRPLSPQSPPQKSQLATLESPKPLAQTNLSAMAPRMATPPQIAAMQPTPAQTAAHLRQMQNAAVLAGSPLFAYRSVTQLAAMLRQMSPPQPLTPAQLTQMHIAPNTPLANLIAMQPQLAKKIAVLVAMVPSPPQSYRPLYAMVTPFSSGAGGLVLLSGLPPLQRYMQQGAAIAQGSATSQTAQALINIVAAQQTLSATPPPAIPPQPGLAAVPAPTVSEDDEVFLKFKLDGAADVALLNARRSGSGPLYIPLADLMQRVGFPIEVAGNLGIAQGWFVTEDRTFKLNELDGYVEIAGRRRPLQPGGVIRAGNQMFVTTAQLEEWFPLKFDFSFSTLTLATRSTEILPQAARLARQKIWQQYSTASRDDMNGPLHTLERPYIDWPSLKIDEGFNYNHAPQASDALTNSLGLQAEGSFLSMDAFLALSFQQSNLSQQQQGFTGGTLRLSRDAAVSETLLGPLAATHVEVGDVAFNRPSLIPVNAQGRGVAFNNKPTGFAGSLNQFELQGEGPLGWDVEVYENESLLAFGNVGTDGRYRFSQLNLRPGLNDFRIVLYGPKGEKQERRQSYYLGEDMVKPGQVIYEAGLTQSTDPVIATNKSTGTSAGTMVLNSFYGINRNLTANFGVAHGAYSNTNDDADTAATVGLRAAFGPMFGQFNVAGYADGSSAYTTRQSLRLGKNTDITAFYSRLSSATTDITQANTLSGLQFSDVLNIGTPLRYGLTYTREGFARKDPEQLVESTQSWRLGRVSFNNSLARRFTPQRDRWENGNLGFAAPVMGLPWRGTLSYQPDAEDLFSSASLATQLKVDEKSTLNLQAQYQPPSHLTSLQGNLQRNLGGLTLGVQSTWQSNNAYQLGVNLGMQFVPEPGAGPLGYKTVPARNEGFGYGSADLYVFVDENMNGLPDAGEPAVAGVQIRNQRNGTVVTTGANGVARLAGLVPDQETNVQLDENSLPDIYLKPLNKWQKLLAHRGYGGKVSLPLVRYGEVAGNVQLPATAKPTDVELWLTNLKGETLERLRPEIDGSFYFQSVPLGTYYVNALAAANRTQQEVVLTKAKPVLGNLQVSLTPKPQP